MINSTVGLMVSAISRQRKIIYVVADDSFHCSLQHLILRSSNEHNYLVVQAMSSKNHKEVHGNKQHVANTAGMEQRSKYQNELTKKKRISNYPKEPNWRQGVSGGTTPLSIGRPSATSTKVVIRFKTLPYKVVKTLQLQQPYQNVVFA